MTPFPDSMMFIVDMATTAMNEAFERAKAQVGRPLTLSDRGAWRLEEHSARVIIDDLMPDKSHVLQWMNSEPALLDLAYSPRDTHEFRRLFPQDRPLYASLAAWEIVKETLVQALVWHLRPKMDGKFV